MMPSQKLAMARRTRSRPGGRGRSSELRQSAESTPSGMPTTTETNHGDHGQLDGGRQAVREIAADRTPGVEALPHVAAHQPRDVVDELHGQAARSNPSSRRRAATCAGVAVSPPPAPPDPLESPARSQT